MSQTVYNFSAGPAVLPKEVLRQVADELPDWRGSGMSVMEMSHRGPEFMGIHAQAVAGLRKLMHVPEDYKVLFMQGGAIAENAIVPLNLLRGRAQADYLLTGQWSARSMKEAARYATINVVADAAKLPAPHRNGETGAYTFVPDPSQWRLSRDSAYLHLCTNETIDGVEFRGLQAVAEGGMELPVEVPVVADVSSHVLSREIDVSRFGCLYGGAQKNIGPAGLTIVIVREDLLGGAHPLCPTAFDYRIVADNDSMYNTPPTFAIWVAGLVFDWIERQGGVAALEQRNIEKAALLYGQIDASGFYENRVRAQDRSRMNVPFFLKDASLDAAFLAGAKAAGLLQLKGHRTVGGMRASIYNAMPVEGVRALVDYMKEFERRHG
ncbi:MAG: 3-phosphoserine/phosphohydroxythreonine transaminase [Burkholderiaceae bacterium]